MTSGSVRRGCSYLVDFSDWLRCNMSMLQCVMHKIFMDKSTLWIVLHVGVHKFLCPFFGILKIYSKKIFKISCIIILIFLDDQATQGKNICLFLWNRCYLITANLVDWMVYRYTAIKWELKITASQPRDTNQRYPNKQFSRLSLFKTFSIF